MAPFHLSITRTLMAGTLATLGMVSSLPLMAEESLTAPVYKVSPEGIEEKIGEVIATPSITGGVAFNPTLADLETGSHGFHLYSNGNCEPAEKDGKIVAAGAAGGPYDPHRTGKHEGPVGNGYLGSLPTLYVEVDGTANIEVSAMRLSMDDLYGKALVIHAYGDNYSDQPLPLGGSGPIIACGVFPTR